MFFLIFLACGENGFMAGRRAFHVDERPMDAYSLFDFMSLHKERLLLPVASEEVQPIEFFTCEGLKKI